MWHHIYSVLHTYENVRAICVDHIYHLIILNHKQDALWYAVYICKVSLSFWFPLLATVYEKSFEKESFGDFIVTTKVLPWMKNSTIAWQCKDDATVKVYVGYLLLADHGADWRITWTCNFKTVWHILLFLLLYYVCVLYNDQTSTLPHHMLDRYSLSQHLSHRSSSMSTSWLTLWLHNKNRTESIMPTQLALVTKLKRI